MQSFHASAIPAASEQLSLLRLLDADVLAHPHTLYHAMRSHDPVHWDPYMHAWVVTSYPEVITVLMNYSADRTPRWHYLDRLGLSFMKPFAEVMLRQMIFMDAPCTPVYVVFARQHSRRARWRSCAA